MGQIKPYRDWELEDFQKAYSENYEGNSRTEVYKKDSGFYQAIYKKGFLDDVFPPKIERKGRFVDFSLEELQKYYKENYEGKGRGEVWKEDSSFYQTVRKKGLLDKVFPEANRGRKGRFTGLSLEDFQDYYEQNHKEKRRGEVKKQDQRFYIAVWKRNFSDDIFPESKTWKGGSSKNWELEDFQTFYKENYKGKSRSEVCKEDPYFYKVVCKKGFNDKVFSPKRTRKGFFTDFSLDGFQDYYNKNHQGKGRSEVWKEDRKFHEAVLKKGFSDEVFPPKKPGPTGAFTDFSLEDLQNYYNKNHKGKSRTEVFKEDQIFYDVVRRRKLSEKVFPQKGCFTDFSLKDFQNYYNKNHKGEGRSEARKDDFAFYIAVWRRGFLDQVFPEKNPFRNLSPKELKDYYERNYNGKGKMEVFKENRRFYNTLKNRKLIGRVLPDKRLCGTYSSFSLEDLQNYYNKNHKSKSRTEVIKGNRRFYDAVLRRGFLDDVFPEDKRYVKVKNLESTIKEK